MDTEPEDFGIDNTDATPDAEPDSLETEPTPESFEEVSSSNDEIAEKSNETATDSIGELPPISENTGFDDMPEEFQQAISEQEREMKALEEGLTKARDEFLEQSEPQAEEVTQEKTIGETQEAAPPASVTDIKTKEKMTAEQAIERTEETPEHKISGSVSELEDNEMVTEVEPDKQETLVPEESMEPKKKEGSSVGETLEEENIPQVKEAPTIAEALGEDAVLEVREEMKSIANDVPAETADKLHQNYESARQDVLQEYEKVYNDKYHNNPPQSDRKLETEESIREYDGGKENVVEEDIPTLEVDPELQKQVQENAPASKPEELSLETEEQEKMRLSGVDADSGDLKLETEEEAGERIKAMNNEESSVGKALEQDSVEEVKNEPQEDMVPESEMIDERDDAEKVSEANSEPWIVGSIQRPDGTWEHSYSYPDGVKPQEEKGLGSEVTLDDLGAHFASETAETVETLELIADELDYAKELVKLESLAPELDPKELKQEIDRLDGISKGMLATLQNENREFTPEEQKEDWAVSDAKSFLKKIESYSILLQGANRGKERGEELDDNQWELIRGKSGVSRLANGIIADGSLDEINTIIGKVEDPKIVSVLEAAKNTSIALVKERNPERFEEIFGNKQEEVNNKLETEKEGSEEPTDEEKAPEPANEPLSNEEIIAGAVEQASEGSEVTQTFSEEFGISEKELDSIPGFNDLEEGQKLLVAENLKDLALGHLEEVQSEKFEEMNKGAGKIRQVWHALRRGSYMKKLGKEVYAENMHAGLDFHKDDLESLVEAAKLGPGVKKLEDGSLQIQYASGFENLTNEQNESVENFNVIANEFSKMPREWQYAKEGSKERKQYDEKEAEFESAKDFVQELKESEENREEAIRFEARMAEGVYLNQIYNENPNIEKQLSTLKDGETWAAAVKRNFKEKGLFMATGAVTRTALTSVMGVAAFPAALLTGTALGGWRGRKKGFQDIDERNFRARYGESMAGMEQTNVNDVVQSTQRLGRLIEKIETSKDPLERAAYMGELERRIDTNALKDEEGKLNFGGRSEKVGNVSRYINKMAEARALLEIGASPAPELEMKEEVGDDERLINLDVENVPQYFEKSKWDEWKEQQKEVLVAGGATEESAENMVTEYAAKRRETERAEVANRRLEKVLELHDAKISEQDKEHVKRATVDGAKNGLKYAFVGAMIADIVADGPISTKVEEVAGDLKESILSADAPSHFGDVVESLGAEEGAVAAEAGAAAATGEQPSTFQDMLEQAKQTVTESGSEAPASAIALEHNVEAGDNLWNIIGDKIDSGMYTEDMGAAQRTHLIDAIKDRFAGMSNEELSEMGFSHIGADGRIDIGALEVGDKLDLSKVLNDTNFMTESLKDTVTLSEEAQASIAENLANPQGAEAVAESVAQSSTESIADNAAESTADTATTATDTIKPGGSGGGGGEEVFSSEAAVMPETDEGVQFEAPTENVASPTGETPRLNDFPAWEEWKNARSTELVSGGASPEDAAATAQIEMNQIRETMMEEVRARVSAEELAAAANYPELGDTEAWDKFTFDRRSELIEQGMTPQQAHSLATLETAQIKQSIESSALSMPTEPAQQTQVETPNYSGAAESVPQPTMGVRMSPEQFQQQQEIYGEDIQSRIESIFIDEDRSGTRAATGIARDVGVGSAVREELRNSVPKPLQRIFNPNRLGRAAEEAIGERAAEATGMNIENNMDQWDSIRRLSMEKYFDVERSLRSAGDSFENSNVRDLSRLLRSFDRAGIEAVPEETVDEYVLRGTSILGGIPKR